MRYRTVVRAYAFAKVVWYERPPGEKAGSSVAVTGSGTYTSPVSASMADAGGPTLRFAQAHILAGMTDGEYCAAIGATGLGKSLCMYVPPAAG